MNVSYITTWLFHYKITYTFSILISELFQLNYIHISCSSRYVARCYIYCKFKIAVPWSSLRREMSKSHWKQDYHLISYKLWKIFSRPSFSPYRMATQPITDKYTTRKQARLKQILVKTRASIQGFICWRIPTTLMVIKEVKKPVVRPATISQLKYLAFFLLVNQDCKIFTDLMIWTTENCIYEKYSNCKGEIQTHAFHLSAATKHKCTT